MSINYPGLLTDEAKRAILTNRLSQFASEAFQHSLNAQVATASNNPVDVAQANEALAILETAITVYQKELDKLPAEVDTTMFT